MSKVEAAAEHVVNARSGTIKEILLYAFPLMIAFVSFSVMGIIDSLVVGHIGTSEQAAVGMGTSLTITLSFFFSGTLSAITSFVAQAYGAGKLDRIRRFVMIGMVLIPFMTLLIAPIWPLVPILLDLMGTTPEVRPHVVAYMQILMLSFPFNMICFTISGYLRGLGDMWTPLIVSLISITCNAILAVVFVLGAGPIEGMGVRGAALATLLCITLSSVMYVGVYFSRSHDRRFQTRSLVRPTWEEIKSFLVVGVPAGAGGVAEMACWTFMTIYISRIAPSELAASTVVWQVIHFSFMPTVALSVAVSSLVGQYLGAERVDLAERVAKRAILFALGFMGFVGLNFIVFREFIIRLFNTDPQVVHVGSGLLLIAALFQPFDALGISSSGVLRGAGDTRFPFFVQLTAGWLLFVPLVLLFGEGLGYGVYGAWMAGLVFLIAVAIANLLRYAKGGWKLRRLV